MTKEKISFIKEELLSLKERIKKDPKDTSYPCVIKFSYGYNKEMGLNTINEGLLMISKIEYRPHIFTKEEIVKEEIVYLKGIYSEIDNRLGIDSYIELVDFFALIIRIFTYKSTTTIIEEAKKIKKLRSEYIPIG